LYFIYLFTPTIAFIWIVLLFIRLKYIRFAGTNSDLLSNIRVCSTSHEWHFCWSYRKQIWSRIEKFILANGLQPVDGQVFHKPRFLTQDCKSLNLILCQCKYRSIPHSNYWEVWLDAKIKILKPGVSSDNHLQSNLNHYCWRLYCQDSIPTDYFFPCSNTISERESTMKYNFLIINH